MTQRTIDAVTFDTWRGQFQAPSATVTPFVRSGVPGVGALKGAAQPQRVEVVATLLDTLANCQTAETTVMALKGTFVAAEDDLGHSYDHVLVEDCRTSITPSLGDSEAVLTVSLVLWPGDTP